MTEGKRNKSGIESEGAAPDARSALASLVDHLDHHPHLIDSVPMVSELPDLKLQLHPRPESGWTHLSLLAEWQRTLTETGPVSIAYTSAVSAHLRLVGRLVDGTTVTVTVVPGRDEVGLLARAGVSIERGATFPVELLLCLAGGQETGQGARFFELGKFTWRLDRGVVSRRHRTGEWSVTNWSRAELLAAVAKDGREITDDDETVGGDEQRG